MFSAPRKPHVLSAAQFKALSTETRTRILKLLGQRKHTQAELAAALGIAAPSVKEHLDALVAARLISKESTDRKWKYFDLTPTGRAILNPEEKAFMFLLTITSFAAVSGVAALLRTTLAVAPPAMPELKTAAFDAAQESASLAMQAPAPDGMPVGLIAYLLLMCALTAITFYFGLRSRKNRELARRLTKA